MSLEDLQLASAEIDENLPEYAKAKAYYDGTDSSQYLNQLFNDVLHVDDFAGSLNYAAIPVDAVADRLQLLAIKGPTAEFDRMIEDLWTANKMPLRFGQFILDLLKSGDHFMGIWPEEGPGSEILDVDTPTELLEATPIQRRAKMTFADATTTRAFYDDGGELLFVARKWEQKDPVGEDIQRLNLFYADRIEKYWWYSKDDAETAQHWFDPDQDEWPMENPYGEIPMFPFATNFPHGQPEHKSLYGVQDALNKIFQTHIASIEYLGFPIIYALMSETSAAGTSDFEYEPIDGGDAASEATGLKNKPGEVWALRANSVGQLEPAGSTSFITSLDKYKEIASELSGLPARLFSSTDGQHPGADAVNAADAVLRQRVVDRSIIISEALKQAISFALRLAYGVELSPDDISVLWRPQKIEIDDKVIATFEFKRRLGVTDRQILSEMGYTTAEIDTFLGVGADRLPSAPAPASDPVIPVDTGNDAS